MSIEKIINETVPLNDIKEANKPNFAPNKVPTMGAKTVTKNGDVKYGFERVLEEQGKL